MAEKISVMKTPLGQPEDLYKNFATDVEMADRAKKLATPMLERARRNRMKSDEKALKRYNQWAILKTDSFYRGRANVKIPAVRKGVEKLVTSWIRATFPTNRWWAVTPEAREFEENVPGMTALMDVQLKKRMRVKRKARPMYRQLAIFGISPVRLTWREETRTEMELVAGEDGETRAVKKTVTVYDDPAIDPVDYFSWGVYPETVMDIDDAKLVYEDEVVDFSEMVADKKNFANLKEARAGAGSGTTGGQAFQKRQERLQRLGITETELMDKAFCFRTTCYLDFDFKDGLGPVPAVMSLAWESVVVRLQRNPYQRPPYRCMKDLEVVGEWLAHSRTEATEGLQIVLDDSANQDQDASSFANNPIMVADPAVVDDYYSIALFPGAKIPAAPDAVKFDRPPDASYGQKEKLAYYHNLILDLLGTPAGTNASPSAKAQSRGARTFGGMQMLEGLASAEAKEVVEFQEDLFWEPLLGDIARLNAMFMADDRILRTAGAKGAAVTVNRDTFKGDYAYEWLGTATMQNQLVLSSQMLVFLNIVRGIPAAPGWTVNMPHLLRSWWEWSGLPDAERVIVESGRLQPIDPEIENRLVELERAVEVAPADNDAQHLVSHLIASQQYQPGDPRLEKLIRHRMEHEQQQQAKLTAELMRVMQSAQPPGMNGGPTPQGSRAGVKPSLNPQTGFGPARAMAAAPATA